MNASSARGSSAGLERLGLKPAPSQANFVYVDCGAPGAADLRALLRKGVIVRPFGGLPSALRDHRRDRGGKRTLAGGAGEVLA